MTLVAGSYERFIWGFSLKTLIASSGSPLEDDETLTIPPLFCYPAHNTCIKSVAAAGPIAASAASGAGEDTIKLYHLPSSSEIGALIDASGGGVTSLAFFSPESCSPALPPRNLLAVTDDGALRIYDADPFVLLKEVPVHRRRANDLAVHPSGRVALSVGRTAGTPGKDACLAMVNLVRGRRSFYCRLDREAEMVRYGGDGAIRFFMAAGNRVSVHDSEDAKILSEMDASKTVRCIAPCESGLLLTGGDDRNVTAWDTRNGKVAYCIEDAHSARVKGLVIFKKRSGGETSEESNCVASASADGVIRIWDVRTTSEQKPKPLAEANTQSRITCLAGSFMKCGITLDFWFWSNNYWSYYLASKLEKVILHVE